MQIAMGASKANSAKAEQRDKSANGWLPGADPFRWICRQIDGVFSRYPVSVLHSEHRMGFAFPARLDLSETDKCVVARLDVPGMDEKDIDVTIRGGALVVTGQREQSREEKAGNYHRMERCFGSFRRVVPLPCEVLEDRIEARLNKGVLTVDLPKAVQPVVKVRNISVKPSLF